MKVNNEAKVDFDDIATLAHKVEEYTRNASFYARAASKTSAKIAELVNASAGVETTDQ